MLSIKDISLINFHDAKATDVIVENDNLIFVIPNGLNDLEYSQNIKSCKLISK